MLPCIIGTGTDKAHGKDGVVCDLWIGIVGEFTEGVEYVKFGVTDGAEGEGERDSSSDHRLAVAQ